VKSNIFAPIFVTGLSGNGKTTMIEQICAKMKRECFRVNITADTDEDELLGSWRLVNGNMEWQDGPVILAMKRGAILLLDEVDLGTEKCMCLQAPLEGKGVYLKKIGQFVSPANGFNIIATANTKGKGSDDGRFVGTRVMNEAALDRYDYTFEQEYAPRTIEKKILLKAMKKFGSVDENFADCLVKWTEIIRKSFVEGAVESFLLATQNLFDVGLLGPQFGEDIAHGVSEHAGKFVEKGFVESERPTVAHGAAQNTAQDVVAVVVPGRNSVGHGEAERPRVVGNDAKSDIDFFLLAMSGRAGLGQRRSVFFAAEFLDLVEERTEDVRFVIRNAGV
jgi:hypothetical protein